MTSTLKRFLFIVGVGLSLALIGVCVPHLRNELSSDNHVRLMQKILSIYAVPLGVIIGGIFANYGQPTTSVTDDGDQRNAATFLLVVWNILVLYGVIVYNIVAPTEKTYGELIRYLEAIPRESAFLIATILTFLSTRFNSKAPPTQRT